MHEMYSPTQEKRMPIKRSEGLRSAKQRKSAPDTPSERPIGYAAVPKVKMVSGSEGRSELPPIDYRGLYMPSVTDTQRDMAKRDAINMSLAEKRMIRENEDKRQQEIQRAKIAQAQADFKKEYQTSKKLADEVRSGERTSLSSEQIWWGKKRTWKDRLHRAVGTVTDFLGF